jgi:hypothetical protein
MSATGGKGNMSWMKEIIYPCRSFPIRMMLRNLQVIKIQTLTTKKVLGGNRSIHSALGSCYMR